MKDKFANWARIHDVPVDENWTVEQICDAIVGRGIVWPPNLVNEEGWQLYTAVLRRGLQVQAVAWDELSSLDGQPVLEVTCRLQDRREFKTRVPRDELKSKEFGAICREVEDRLREWKRADDKVREAQLARDDKEYEERVPDLAEYVIGFRAWNVSGERIVPIGAGNDVWSGANEVRATCGKGELHRAPHPDCECVPFDTEILTQRGWLRHDEVRVGDLTLGVNPATRQTEWTPIMRVLRFDEGPMMRVGNDYWHVKVTPNHRHPIWERGKQRYLTTRELPGQSGTDPRTGEQREIVTRAPYVGGTSAVTPTEAAVIAWLHTDGDLRSQRIAQTKQAGIDALRLLLKDVPHSEHTQRDGRVFFRIRSSYFHSLWKKSGLSTGVSLARLVTTLTPDALASFMEAAWQAEGSMNGSCRVLTQNAGATCDALVLGSYLMGHRPRVRTHDSASSFSPVRGSCRRITLCSSRIRGQRLEIENLDPEPSWCVTTGLGTWTMRQDENVVPTGNCGLYAWADWDSIQAESGTSSSKVCGAVQACGRMEIHRDGFRSEFMRPVVLGYDNESEADFRRVTRIAEWLGGIPVVPYDEVPTKAREFGLLVADNPHLLPGAE